MSIKLIRSSAAGLVLAAAMSALAPAPAAAFEHATCECIPKDDKPCYCDKKFKLGGEATKTYRGHCSYFNNLDVNSADRSLYGPYTNAWEDTDGNIYTQDMQIRDQEKPTHCAQQVAVNVYRQQECTNWNVKADHITVRVTCYKNR